MINQEAAEKIIAQNERLIKALEQKDAEIRRLDFMRYMTKNEPIIKVGNEYMTKEEFEARNMPNPNLKDLFKDVAQENIEKIKEENQQLKELVQYLLNEISETKAIAQERFKNILYKLS